LAGIKIIIPFLFIIENISFSVTFVILTDKASLCSKRGRLLLVRRSERRYAEPVYHLLYATPSEGNTQKILKLMTLASRYVVLKASLWLA
jgi:hypothetical protein